VKKTPRFWCRYEDLEEYHAGMWRKVSNASERKGWLVAACIFLRDPELFRAKMQEVLDAWPTSCLHAFTNPSLNKPVWLAHAAAALVSGIPEEFMRQGYWELSLTERERADRDAIEIASRWRDPRA